MKFFTTEGPVNSRKHYCLPPLKRFDLEDILRLILNEKYFLLHAPRQTGKTTCLMALTEYLNKEGKYRALYANIETAQAARENVGQGIAAVVQAITEQARRQLKDDQIDCLGQKILAEKSALVALEQFLSAWCEQSARPSVLMLDEVDALVGDTLISLLRQLRSGYPSRPKLFPQSVILCGVRDIRDYRIHSSSEKAIITGGSAFNIKAKSLRLGDFTEPEVATLLYEHTRETGQIFEPDACKRVWMFTGGQPWLVNALAFETCFEMKEGRNRACPITAEMILQAKERLIQARATHLDQLADKLREPRVRRVIEPMLAGQMIMDISDDDRQYVIDLGLVKRDGSGGLIIANPIYREVIPRTLAGGPQDSLPHISPTWLNPDGSLNTDNLLQAFLAFWRQHGEPLMGSAPYHEIAPHLVLMAFLHRVVNAGGYIDREYAIGRGRMDLCVRYAGVILGIELKVWRDKEPDPLDEGLEQIDGYLLGLGQDTGWLVIFDRRGNRPRIRERTGTESARTPSGKDITVIRA
ncbi:MAG: ATP-binding protein [Deltaproteobacteria bacterium]|nr:ATP-binding protein [Deltaproteobacteria bacterium]